MTSIYAAMKFEISGKSSRKNITEFIETYWPPALEAAALQHHARL
jgi:hypothetical protein